MKVNKVTVENDLIIGLVKPCKQVLNLSSLPQGLVNALLRRMPNVDEKIKVLDLYPNATEKTDNKIKIIRFKGKNTQKPVMFIVDDDDQNYNAKIKNLSMINKYICFSIIIIKMHKQTRINTIDKNGKIIKVGNHHHTTEVFKTLGMTQFSASKAASISYLTIVKTTDDRAGSIAGLTYAATTHDVKFEIEKANISYKECWLSTKRAIKMHDLEMQPLTEGTVLKTDDRFWNYKTGYGEYIKTDTGIRKLMITKVKTPKKTKDTGWLSRIIDIITELIKRFLKSIVSWYTGKEEK